MGTKVLREDSIAPEPIAVASPTSMPFVTVPFYPGSIAPELPTRCQNAMSKDCHRFWVDIMTPQHCRGSAKPLIFVCDASVEPFPQVIRCRSDQSLAATFCTFPKWLYISKDAKDTAAGVPLSDMYASDCEEMLQGIARCARQMLRELPHQNTRRRRMTALLQECFRVEQYQRSLAQNQNKPFQTL